MRVQICQHLQLLTVATRKLTQRDRNDRSWSLCRSQLLLHHSRLVYFCEWTLFVGVLQSLYPLYQFTSQVKHGLNGSTIFCSRKTSIHRFSNYQVDNHRNKRNDAVISGSYHDLDSMQMKLSCTVAVMCYKSIRSCHEMQLSCAITVYEVAMKCSCHALQMSCTIAAMHHSCWNVSCTIDTKWFVHGRGQ